MTGAYGDKREVFLVATKAILMRPDGSMLTLLRGKTAPTNPLGWDLPGGILDHGEGVDEGIIREVKEETGLDIKNPRVFHAIARPNVIDEHWTTIYFLAHTDSDAVQISWEHEEYKWVTPEDFVSLHGSGRNRDAVQYFLELKRENTI